ncbi:DinB family protein [Aquibacillus salsiterrae]|uniref:DinB family protein n=1 Tax=Aquibacillus salsiterrae TaxID=2950439 RepID=A0A9X3WIH6_9BACI|nr:DinB family protein [Aquibacillus salsiterrae]MDC3417661.1 DinB family protein [Aquibacillus salsiterrae]
MRSQMQEVSEFLLGIPSEKLTYRYEQNKWTIKEIGGHIIDNERIFANRLLRIARGDKTPIPGYDQEEYVKVAAFNSYDISTIVQDYRAVRQASLTFINMIETSRWLQTGIANGHDISARALVYVIAGHEIHHINLIKEKYL